MNVAECIRSRRSIFKYRLKPFLPSMIVSIIIDVSNSSSWECIPIIRYIVIKFSSILGTIVGKPTPYYNFKIDRSIPVLTAGNFTKKMDLKRSLWGFGYNIDNNKLCQKAFY